MDLPEPRGSDRLLAAMSAAQERFDTDAERELLDALAAAELLVPLVTDPESGSTVAARLGGADGAQALVAFTHAAAAEGFAGSHDVELGLVAASALAATAVDADQGLVLNPDGPHAGQLDRRALDSLAVLAGPPADGADASPAGSDKSAGFELRPPSVPLSPALADALRAAITNAPTLREAWHAEVTGAGPDHGLLVLVGDGEAPPEAITDLLAAELPEGETMDLLPVDTAGWDGGDYDTVRAAAVPV